MLRLRIRIILALLVSVFAAQSCEFVSSFLHDGEVVAKVGKYKLFREEVEAMIPAGVSAEDSLRIAEGYINSWATDRVFLSKAEEMLPKAEQDLKKELEQYKNALLKYRYEQQCIDEKLDTAVSEEQIVEYYENHSENLRLSYPIVKARYIRIVPGTITPDKAKKILASSDPDNKEELDKLIYSCSDRYNDFGGNWVEITALAREFSTDYGTLISQMSDSFVVVEESDGKYSIAYIPEYIKSGKVPPMEFCRAKIENVVLSARKQALLNDLEQELLDEARNTGLFETID